jgi:AcrR family transcriptional regulator
MTAHKTLSPINATLERNAFYDASLRLVKDGKFQAMSVTEIAFMARISEGAIPFIFESRERLVTDLIEHVTSQITKTIEDAAKKSTSYKRRFFDVWYALYEHYTKNPNVIAFIEQFDNINKNKTGSIHPASTEALIELFRKAQIGEVIKPVNAETLAYIFHENVVTAAKMYTSKLFVDVNFAPQHLPEMLWASISANSNS